MFFKTSTVYKVYATQKGAQAYINKFLCNVENVTIQVIDGKFYVVAL